MARIRVLLCDPLERPQEAFLEQDDIVELLGGEDRLSVFDLGDVTIISTAACTGSLNRILSGVDKDGFEYDLILDDSFFISGKGLVDLTDDQIDEYKKRLRNSEMYVYVDRKLTQLQYHSGMDAKLITEHKAFSISKEDYLSGGIYSINTVTGQVSHKYKEPSAFEKAKEYIEKYHSEEFGPDDKGAFEDPTHIGLGYTTITDAELPVEIFGDLVTCKIDRYLDGVLVERRQYDTLADMVSEELQHLDFGDLIDLPDDLIEEIQRRREDRGSNLDLLPERCYVFVESEGIVGVVEKGKMGYTLDHSVLYPSEETVTALNEDLGVTSLQAACMKNGSMFGWDTPGADPRNFAQIMEEPLMAQSEQNTTQPVGQIKYLNFSGQTKECIPYCDKDQFIEDIMRSNYYGEPVVIEVFKNGDGQTIPMDFVERLDPPVPVRIVEYSEEPTEKKGERPQVDALEILDKLDKFRRDHQNDSLSSPDWIVRVAEAIVSEAAGYSNRNSWTEVLAADPTTSYSKCLNSPADGIEAYTAAHKDGVRADHSREEDLEHS